MDGLVWNETHTTNSLHQYCYCEQDRSLLDKVVQCRGCKNWFHTKCTSIKDPPTTLFVVNYQFECHNCNELNVEIFERTAAGWKEVCTASLANLALEAILLDIGTYSKELLESKNELLMEKWQPEKYYFNKKDLVTFLDKHWDSICTERSRTPTWWATLGSCLYSSKDMFIARNENERSATSDFRLADSNLWHIRPHPASSSLAAEGEPSSARMSNRLNEISPEANRLLTSNTPSPRSSSPVPLTPNTVPAVFPQGTSANTDHPFNRFGFKYSPCESSILPLVAYQQSENSLGGCTISIPDKSSYVSVTKDGLTVTTDKGFRMCRANVGVKEGNWFWEAKIQNAAGPASNGAHVRLGFARREACLNAPVGYDAYGYAYRDKTGDKMFCSRPEKYGEPFQSGDVIGLYISIPAKNKAKFQSALRRRIPIAYKERFWFEEKDYRPSKEMEALADPYRKDKDNDYESKKLEGSFITVYKNGVNQGVMFTDLIDFEDFGRLPETILAKRAKKKRKQSKKDHGSSMPRDDFDSVTQHWTDDPPVEDDGTLGYYPAVSVFKGGVVNCNFGPNFQHPPIDQKDWKPLSQRYNDYMVEECVWDLVDEVSRSFKYKKN
ncbi:hypothetical protein BD408DRAFT_480294 [Parasitella parasitica]|nr:hypothetical protein BD408DRAFT_480294 [Parasitella parasitica]